MDTGMDTGMDIDMNMDVEKTLKAAKDQKAILQKKYGKKFPVEERPPVIEVSVPAMIHICDMLIHLCEENKNNS